MKRMFLLAGIAAWFAGPASFVGAVPIQDVYEAAGPGEGYDKLMVLDGDVIYTGALAIGRGVQCCIHGNGATIDLEHKSIWAPGYGTVLDIDHCVLINGYSGIYIFEDAMATIRNNTIVENDYGVTSWYGNPNVVIENNIIANNEIYGIYCREYFEPFIQYNCVWGNENGNYMKNCG